MNIQKFTQKSVEAINDCEKLAYEYGNQEIEQEHLLVALMRQEDGLIPKLIEKMEIQKEHFMDNAERHLAARVKVSGGQVYVGQDLNKVLIHAEDEAKQMGDEYEMCIRDRSSWRQYVASSSRMWITSSSTRSYRQAGTRY